MYTISGIPNEGGVFNYKITSADSDGFSIATGIITVRTPSSLSLNPGSDLNIQTICANSPFDGYKLYPK